MSRHIHLATHLSVAELEQRYRAAHEPHERSGWQMLWLLARGQSATAIADTTGYNRAWLGQIAKRYNEQGPAGMVNRPRTTSWRAPRMLSAQQQEELQAALAGPAPAGPALRLHRGTRRCPVRSLRYPPTAARAHPLHHPVPLVAQADPQTTWTEAELI